MAAAPPACGLRVVCDPARVDPRFIATPEKLDRLADLVAREWPESIAPDDLQSPALWQNIRNARTKLLAALDLTALA